MNIYLAIALVVFALIGVVVATTSIQHHQYNKLAEENRINQKFKVGMESLFDGNGACLDKICVGDILLEPGTQKPVIVTNININTKKVIVQRRTGAFEAYPIEELKP